MGGHVVDGEMEQKYLVIRLA
jgi:hypothetical protein